MSIKLTFRALALGQSDGKTSGWYKSNFLEGNYSKYQAIVIARDTQQTELVINNSKIYITDAFKLLGVIIHLFGVRFHV